VMKSGKNNLGARVAERADDGGGNVGSSIAQRDRAFGVSTSAPGGHETCVESSKRLSVLVLLATTAGHPTAILQEPRWLPTY
jgi:hypothetical protein